MPRVSVIIPNYNHARFLTARLESVFGQTFQDFEVIFLDDASTDDSRAVFEKIAEPQKNRVTAVFNDTNSGNPFKQWNKGARIAKGEYLWIAESDDYADPRFLSELVSILDNTPSVGLGYCRSSFIDEFDNVQEWLFEGAWEKSFIKSGQEFIQTALMKNPIPNASAAIMRKVFFERVGYAEETMSFCGDWATWLKIAWNSDVGFSAKPLSFFRKHSTTVSSRVAKTMLPIFERYRVIELLLQSGRPDEDLLERALDSMGREWVSRAFSIRSQMSWRQNIAIYKVAAKVDSRIQSRLVKRVLAFALRKVGISKAFDKLMTSSARSPNYT